MKDITKTETKKYNKWPQSGCEKIWAKWFCCAFRSRFSQLICKASLIFKSNLELGLSVILKKRLLCESKYTVLECKCLKTSDLLSFFVCSLILVLKWRHVSTFQIELQLTQGNYKPGNISNEIKTSLIILNFLCWIAYKVLKASF